VPASQNWVDLDANTVDPLAFRPRESDTTGLSVGRAKYESSEEEAARGSNGRRFYIAILSVCRMQAARIKVMPRPLANYPGHAEIPELTFENRRTDRAREVVQLLRDCVVAIEGPFDGACVHE
jgi:hypothetical protein